MSDKKAKLDTFVRVEPNGLRGNYNVSQRRTDGTLVRYLATGLTKPAAEAEARKRSLLHQAINKARGGEAPVKLWGFS